MEGVTEGCWLPVLERHSWVNCWWMPFIRISTAVPRPARLSERLRPYLAGGLPVIAQLMGTDTSLLAESTACLFDLGVRVVDLNCACPAPAVIANGAGGRMLQDPEWICRTLLSMKTAAGGRPVTVKLRMGWQDPSEFERAIAPAIRAAAPAMATVHFRTVSELYRPVPDGLQRMSAIRAALPGITLCGAGDLFTPDDILVMRQQCGVDCVAPARGMLRRPWLLAETAARLAGRPFDPPSPHAILQEFAQAPIGFRRRLAKELLTPEQFREYLAHDK